MRAAIARLILFVAFGSILAGIPAIAQPAGGDPMATLPGLREQSSKGTLRCPDGSTRSYAGTAPSDLVISMKCAVPAEKAEERTHQAERAVAAKNAAAEQQAAAHGGSGVIAWLIATVTTGTLNDALGWRISWVLGLLAVAASIGAILRYLLGGRG